MEVISPKRKIKINKDIIPSSISNPLYQARVATKYEATRSVHVIKGWSGSDTVEIFGGIQEIFDERDENNEIYLEAMATLGDNPNRALSADKTSTTVNIATYTKKDHMTKNLGNTGRIKVNITKSGSKFISIGAVAATIPFNICQHFFVCSKGDISPQTNTFQIWQALPKNNIAK